MLRWLGWACGFGLVLACWHGCSAEEVAPSPASQSSAGGSLGGGGDAATGPGGGGGGGGGSPPSFCQEQQLPEKAFDAKGPYGILRHDRAADFTLPLRGNADWHFAAEWTGCDSYVFISSALVNSALDSTSIWKRDVDTLIAKSPPNAHYFFVAARKLADAAAELDDMQTRIDAALAKLDAAKAAFWRARLHLVAKHASELDGWVGTLLATNDARGGFGIDRDQRIRFIGNFADVFRFKQALQNAMQWPWEANLAYASYEARHYNYEATRDAALAADGATVVSAWKDEVLKGVVEKDVTFPDAKGFDTLTIDVSMDCPDPTKGEFGNCGAWDYIANLFVLGDDGKTWIELARFITSYHREGHYTVDATPMLLQLGKGGVRKLRFVVSPDWNQQAYLSRVDFRYGSKKKGYAPSQAVYLWSGADFNSAYNSKFAPIDVAIPAAAKRVELWAIITGHGGATFNCAEFCNHQHQFTVNGKVYLHEHPMVGKQDGCVPELENGLVPNQGGTWWFGRGGWCPGEQVNPYVQDVTADVTPGQKATLSYKGMLSGKDPPDNAGTIVMSSYLVIYQ